QFFVHACCVTSDHRQPEPHPSVRFSPSRIAFSGRSHHVSDRSVPWRLVAAIAIVSALLVSAGYTFWLEDWRWSLPTPRPVNLEQPLVGKSLTRSARVAELIAQSPGKPLFLHFFNPDCPCSRFNQDHVRDLIRTHARDASFVAVIEPEGSVPSADAAS